MNIQTALQQAQQAEQARQDSINGRNVGGTMGKHDFLMLLSAQLRYQDPLNPQSDSEFAAQLAQFSSLEQMQNMNETLSAMASYQSYSLVGKYVVANALIDNVLMEIPGIVDCIFTRNGTTFAQVGEYVVPVSSISDVFDQTVLITPDSLMATSNNLIGRTVMAQVGETVVEGLVTRITVDRGIMYARIDDGSENGVFVPVAGIFDIRETGTPGDPLPPNPALRPELDRPNLVADGEDWIETDSPGGVGIGRWSWDKDEQKWVATGFIVTDDEGVELGRWSWIAEEEQWSFVAS
jgi:flagellar basal-body rod modification protein FlgD